jgi:hypothetical protein
LKQTVGTVDPGPPPSIPLIGHSFKEEPVRRFKRAAAVLLAALVCFAVPGAAQNVTTGSIRGTVTDGQGGVLPGADVVAVHEPTGTSSSAVTQSDGTYSLLNLQVGPYTVTARLSGFREQSVKGVVVKLGEDVPLNLKLGLETLTETVSVVAEANPVFSPTRTGTAANVTTQAIENMPTVARTLEDFARLSPHFTPTPQNDNPSAPVSVAGRNPRYNNMQIDGAVNNDLFGLSDSATPGGPAGTQPISLDAVQELQLVVTPYDVRQGGFAGGGINAITRSGSNQVKGTVYYQFRDQSLVGSTTRNQFGDFIERDIADFSDKQFGASVGGPIARNRAFFFVNVDAGRRATPSGVSADGSSGQTFTASADAARVRDILRTNYGYDPGALSEFSRKTDNDKVFARVDAVLSDKHRLTVRHNWVDGANDVGTTAIERWIFPDFFYNFDSTTNSTVGQLNSTFGSLFNEARVTYTRVRDNRDGDTRFPAITVRSGSARILAGTENFSTANRLDQDVIELTDDLTMVRGKHTWTFGTHNEFFKFDNLFIRDNFGNYEFASVDQLAAGLAQGFSYSFSTTADPQQSAKFSVNQLGFYAGDQWRVRDNFSLNYGVRLDVPLVPDAPTRNPITEDAFGYRTDVTPGGDLQWSPRVGFNWNLGGAARQQVRGGIGMFVGRTPYVWLSNQYGNTGIEFRRLSVTFNANNRIPFNADPDNQPTSVGNAATNEIDLVDPDYQYPRVVRGNLAYDRALGFLGLVGSVELVFADSVKDIDYRNLNLLQTDTRPDGRPFYGRQVATLSDVVLLTNTTEGAQWSLSGAVERNYSNGLYFRASYLYGSATSVNDGTSSQARSNWVNVYSYDINAPDVARSNFEVRHRINAAVSYDFKLPKSIGLTTSAYWNSQQGRPYVITWGSDYNGDGGSQNDLFPVPEVGTATVTNGTVAALDAFIAGDDSLRDFRGQVAPRNAAYAPWTNTIDFRIAANVPIGRFKPEFTFDILNLGNLLSSETGEIRYALFNQSTPVTFGGIDAATGQPIYNISTLTRTAVDPSTNEPRLTYQKFNRDDLRSRWQAQIGLRVRF